MADEFRSQLVMVLRGQNAHMSFDEAVADFPEWAINERAPNVDYTPWHLIEHLRLTQWDSLRYVEDPDGARVARVAGRILARSRRDDRHVRLPRAPSSSFAPTCGRSRRIALDESRDLVKVLAGTPGHTPLRSIVIVGGHNSYHVGEFASLRQIMGSWPASHR